MTTDGNPFSWITSHAGLTEHAVTHDAQAVSRAAGRGVYEALCGAALLAASMDVGPARRCSGCAAFLRTRTRPRGFDQGMGRRPSWLSRLCHRVPATAHQVKE
jgi:hypothetical protein